MNIDTLNKYGVGVQGEKVVVLLPPRTPMTKTDALILAAWLVTMADMSEGEADFQEILKAVQS